MPGKSSIPAVVPADIAATIRFTTYGNAVCPNCGDPCHPSHLTATGCTYCDSGNFNAPMVERETAKPACLICETATPTGDNDYCDGCAESSDNYRPNDPALKDGRIAYAIIDDGCIMDVYGTRERAASHVIGNPAGTFVAPVRWDYVSGQWFIEPGHCRECGRACGALSEPKPCCYGGDDPSYSDEPIPADNTPNRIADIASELAEVNGGEHSGDAREHSARLTASLHDLILAADDGAQRDVSNATLKLAGLQRLIGGRDADESIAEIIVSARDAETIAAYASDWASDCQWLDMPLTLGELEPVTLIACAARVYDGGLASLVSDALHDGTTVADDVPADCDHGYREGCPDCDTSSPVAVFNAGHYAADIEPSPEPPALTIATLQRIAARAVNDHTPDNRHCDCQYPAATGVHEEWCCTITPRQPLAPMLAAHQVTITAINPPSDSVFDRCSYGRRLDESFTVAGIVYRIADYHGSYSNGMPWRVISEDNDTPRAIFTEKELAGFLNRERAHPNPYIGSVECTYDIRGHRALYGVRTDGTIELWQD